MLLKIIFHYIKGYLGKKDMYIFLFYIIFTASAVANGRNRNKFGIPDVLNKPYLLLYPYIIIFVLLFIN